MPRRVTVVLLTIACIASPLRAEPVRLRGGLKMNYTKIAIENIPIGRPISMRELVNLPLTIGSRFDKPMPISIRVESPQAPRAGYEALPDPAWVELESERVTVSSGEEAQVDVVLRVPDDGKWLGRRFQADIVVGSGADAIGGGVSVGYEIRGSVLFSTAPVRNLAALEQALQYPADASFVLDPPRVDIFEVTPGKRLHVLTQEDRPVRLVNLSSREQDYVLAAIDPGATAVSPDRGSQVGQIEAVGLEETEIRLSAEGHADVPLTIDLPANADLSKGPMLYLVEVRSGPMLSLSRYIKVYLWGGAKPVPRSGIVR